MADKQNTENIPCTDCKSFDIEDGEPLCLKNCVDFRTQLMSGQTLICKAAERKVS